MAGQGWEAGFLHSAWHLLRPQVVHNHRKEKKKKQIWKQICLRELSLFHLICRQVLTLPHAQSQESVYGIIEIMVNVLVSFSCLCSEDLSGHCVYRMMKGWWNAARLHQCKRRVRRSLIQTPLTEYGESFTRGRRENLTPGRFSD